MADSRQSIFNAAKQAAYVKQDAENFYKPGSWQHKAWADGVQAGVDAALALAPVVKTMVDVLQFENAGADAVKAFQKFSTSSNLTSEEMYAMLERLSAPPPPVIEHIRCLRADADNCDLCGNVQRAERLRNKALKLAHRYSAY